VSNIVPGVVGVFAPGLDITLARGKSFVIPGYATGPVGVGVGVAVGGWSEAARSAGFKLPYFDLHQVFDEVGSHVAG